MNKKEYQKMTKQLSGKSKVLPDCLNAFWTGGLICVVGQALSDLYTSFGLEKKSAATAVSITLIFIAILLTGLSVYQKFAKIGGAGTLVPITGFANAMSAPAIEFKTEGFVLGVGAKLFSIAGPVIVYGVLASAVYGLILMIIKTVFGG